MGKTFIDDPHQIDRHGIESNALLQLKEWKKKMYRLIDKTYVERQNEVERIVDNLETTIEEKRHALKQMKNGDSMVLMCIQDEIDQWNSLILIEEKIPTDFHRLIEETIRLHDDEEDFVIIDSMEKKDHPSEHLVIVLPSSVDNNPSRLEKFLSSELVQQVLTLGLTQAVSHLSTRAATMAFRLGQLAMATMKKF